MGSPERRAAFAERGVHRAEEFRWETTARETLETYLSAIEGRPPAPPGPHGGAA